MMKTTVKFFALAFVLFATACNNDDEINMLNSLWRNETQNEARIDDLEKWCTQANTDITSLQTIVNVIESNDVVTSVTPIMENGVEIGYTITFADHDPITIYHGKDGKDGQNGADGQDGDSMFQSVTQDADNVYFTLADGTLITIAKGDDDSDTPSAGISMFSVAVYKEVTFSPGNLQYTQSTNKWSFAENQWDYIGTDNVTGGEETFAEKRGYEKDGAALADKIDLFGWSTSATNFGVSISISSSDYSGTFVDWGTNQIGDDAPNTWRTLTKDEWLYLLNTRTNASSLKGVAQVNGVNGLILLPDSWTCPAGVTFRSGFHSELGVDYYASYQTFTAAEWSKMEQAGAVFLPAAGYRNGSVVLGVQYRGYYWSATEYNSSFAYYLGFYSGAANVDGSGRDGGQSVRLVKDL